MSLKTMESYGDQIKASKIEQLREYYSEKDVMIVGLNATQGVNSKKLFRKGILEYLAKLIKEEKNSTKIINAFSLMFNKTEHVDYFLESNLSVEEIKDLQVNSIASALEKTLIDFHMPKFIGKIGYVSKVFDCKKKEDKNTFLTDSIRCADDPIIIYSCGANDLMREGWNNPIDIERDYQNKEKNDNYNYTLSKFEDYNIVKKVIGNIEKNFNNILGLNSNADIFALGIYAPRNLQLEEMEIINLAIAEYNRKLEELCKKYGVQYINTEVKGQQYSKGQSKFMISSGGQKVLAETIAIDLFNRKLGVGYNISKPIINSDLNVYNHGTMDLLINLKHDLDRLKKESVSAVGREAEVYKAKIKEVERQKEVVEKVILKRM